MCYEISKSRISWIINKQILLCPEQRSSLLHFLQGIHSTSLRVGPICISIIRQGFRQMLPLEQRLVANNIHSIVLRLCHAVIIRLGIFREECYVGILAEGRNIGFGCEKPFGRVSDSAGSSMFQTIPRSSTSTGDFRALVCP